MYKQNNNILLDEKDFDWKKLKNSNNNNKNKDK